MFDSLQKNFQGDIEYTDDILKKYSTDWSLFTVMPTAVVYPKDSQDIRALVVWVGEYNAGLLPGQKKLSITARAAGTDMTGGPLNEGIIMDVTRYMNGVADVSMTDQYPDQQSFWGHEYAIAGEATVLPGTFYRDFESATLEKELILPCYPASKALCAVGGMVANNGAGEKSLKYGQNKDFVQKLKVVLADGNEYVVEPLTKKQLDTKIAQKDFEGDLYKQVWELVRDNYQLIQNKKPTTSKNASGYYLWDVIQASSLDAFVRGEGYFDLTKLFVGAQGTTGLITEITYKLVQTKHESDLLVIYVDDFDTVPELVNRLMKSDLEMLEVYDDKTFRIGMKFFKDFVKDKGLFGAIRYAMRFIPDVIMAMFGGIPKLFVLASFMGDNEQQLHVAMRETADRIKPLGVRTRQIKRKKGEERFWDFRHDSFKILSEHTKHARDVGAGTRTAPFIEDIVVDPQYLPEYLPRLQNLLNEYGVSGTLTLHGHLGNGNLHLVPLLDMHDPSNIQIVPELSEKVYALALEYGASISAEHNDGISRTAYVPMMFGDSMTALFGKVKRIFDPENIFNPGKKVGMTAEDIKKYLV